MPSAVAPPNGVSTRTVPPAGTDVRVRPSGTGYRVELAFQDLDEALALARRLRPRAVA